jgi:ubiquinol-cytochrome c reductase cytochrome b subunit
MVKTLSLYGASFFFFLVYVHMFKNFYYGSYLYPRQILWVSGAILWFLMIMTAFLGYILPWGQMSVWGAIVITIL